MDDVLRLPFVKREGIAPGLADTPLYSFGWRYLKTQFSRQKEEIKAEAESVQQRRKSLAKLAQEVFQLKRLPDSSPGVMEAVLKLQSTLEQLDTHILAPDGEPYNEEMMEVLDNLVVHPDSAYSYPVVKETVIPTIFSEGELVQRGKAVIGVPFLNLDSVTGLEET